MNEDIVASNVRLVGAGGEQRGIVSRSEALAEARSSGLDLVLVAAEAEPPVCKVMDYGKHVFELKKTKAAQRKKQKPSETPCKDHQEASQKLEEASGSSPS